MKWHSMSSESRKRNVYKLHSYSPNFDDQFIKPKLSGRKKSDRTRAKKPTQKFLLTALKKKESRKISNLKIRMKKKT